MYWFLIAVALGWPLAVAIINAVYYMLLPDDKRKESLLFLLQIALQAFFIFLIGLLYYVESIFVLFSPFADALSTMLLALTQFVIGRSAVRRDLVKCGIISFVLGSVPFVAYVVWTLFNIK